MIMMRVVLFALTLGGPVVKGYSVSISRSISSVGRDAWESCLRPTDSPFVSVDFLSALEESECACVATGWDPVHLTVSDDESGEIIAVAPMYAKGHSFGEFIFDNAWAEAAYNAGIDYYPKLLLGIPFTPATTRKILIREGVPLVEEVAIRKFVGTSLRNLCSQNGLSSVHLNFGFEDEVQDVASSHGEYCERASLQWHFQNRVDPDDPTSPKFSNFEHYLSSFKSKRRISIRRERRKVREESGMRVDVLAGEDIRSVPGIAKVMYELYKSTVDKMYPYGRLYLNEKIFESLIDGDFCKNLVFVLARHSSCGDGIQADDVVAGTFNVVGNSVFYGRYWGAFEDVKFLHFDVCYYASIEYCINAGLERMEPGAGGGEFKFLRGFNPALVHSTHWLAHPGLRGAVTNFVNAEREELSETADYLLREKSALKKKSTP